MSLLLKGSWGLYVVRPTPLPLISLTKKPIRSHLPTRTRKPTSLGSRKKKRKKQKKDRPPTDPPSPMIRCLPHRRADILWNNDTPHGLSGRCHVSSEEVPKERDSRSIRSRGNCRKSLHPCNLHPIDLPHTIIFLSMHYFHHGASAAADGWTSTDGSTQQPPPWEQKVSCGESAHVVSTLGRRPPWMATSTTSLSKYHHTHLLADLYLHLPNPFNIVMDWCHLQHVPPKATDKLKCRYKTEQLISSGIRSIYCVTVWSIFYWSWLEGTPFLNNEAGEVTRSGKIDITSFLPLIFCLTVLRCLHITWSFI